MAFGPRKTKTMAKAIVGVDKMIKDGIKYNWEHPNCCLAGGFCHVWRPPGSVFDPMINKDYEFLSNTSLNIHFGLPADATELDRDKHEIEYLGRTPKKIGDQDWPKVKRGLMKAFNLTKKDLMAVTEGSKRG